MARSFLNFFIKSKAKVVNAPRDKKRFNDAVFLVRQNNAEGSLTIEGLNIRAKQLSGYDDAITGLDLRSILPKDIAETVSENMEFSNEGRGLNEVLPKIPNFRIKDADNINLPVNLRVIRGVSTEESPIFQVVLNDASLSTAILNRHAKLAQNPAYFNVERGVPGKAMILDDISMIIAHGRKYNYRSSFMMVKVGNPEYSLERVLQILQRMKRESDIIGLYADNLIIVLMPDTPEKNTVYPIRRFKSLLSDDLRSRVRISAGELKENFEEGNKTRKYS